MFPTNFANIDIAFSCMETLEHNFDICWLKLSWLSISIPSKFTDLVVSISLLYIFNVLFDSPFFYSYNSSKRIRIGYHVIVPKPIYRWFWFFSKCTEEVVQIFASNSDGIIICKIM